MITETGDDSGGSVTPDSELGMSALVQDSAGNHEKDALDFARRIVSRRRLRAHFLPGEIFGEPAWDMLLDLFVAFYENKPISVSSACIASGAPATTALRWLARLELLGLVKRTSDHKDRRRIHVAITSKGKQAVVDWLCHVINR